MATDAGQAYRPTFPDPYAAGRNPPRWLEPLLPAAAAGRKTLYIGVMRILVAATLILGFYYLSWRVAFSINWAFWPIAIGLLICEMYSYVDSWMFGLAMWRYNPRPQPGPAPVGLTVDVFITCYNEPPELVRLTARAARRIRYPHRTFILDDGSSPAMRQVAEEEGVEYIVRSDEWKGRDRHAKAGNLVNAMFRTDGEFMLILDADMVPAPEILDRTLGYFNDPKMSVVQTVQWFYNVPPDDPMGCQAPLFYGPIQQGKDGWNAAFFCGSNAVLRREALMHMGIHNYVDELERRVRQALSSADKLLRDVQRGLNPAAGPAATNAIDELRRVVGDARGALNRGEPIQEITWGFQREAEAIARRVVSSDLAQIQADLADVPGLEPEALSGLATLASDDAQLASLTGRTTSPLAAIATVRDLLVGVDVDREHEAVAVIPMATISVTEDMATAMRLHALGWKSVYHHELLAVGLAPEDLRSSMQQRLRWAQGTIQVMLRENPLFKRGLSLIQRLMYFATMWSYLSGFFALVYLAAPVLYIFLGWLPVRAYTSDFFWHLIPYMLVNQLLFVFAGWGLPTWRGRQYSLALFPLWIQAVTSAFDNVYRGKKLGFVVTPKTRQGAAPYSLIRAQLITMALLLAAILWGLLKLALGLSEEWLPILINSFWAAYDIVMLSAVLDAVNYRPQDEAEVPLAGLTAAEAHGRPLSGSASAG